MAIIRLAPRGKRSESMLAEQRWIYKMVRYDEGRTGQVIDLSMDGKRLCIRREHARGRDSETTVVWKNSDEVEVLDVKPREQ